MPTQLSELSPPIKLGDKLVHVGVLSWGGFKAVLAELAKAELPLPKLCSERIGRAFGQIQSCYAAAAQESDPARAHLAAHEAGARLYELLARLLADNLDTLASWLLAHPPIVSALVQGSSNLSIDEVDRLTAGESLRVARAAWAALAADGFFTEAAGFFVDLVGLGTTGRSTTSRPPPEDCASAPDSPSGSMSP
ncbi:MAG TPA: hypothetical protein VGX78_07635 [Pirellulales bacterium]|nr:hypothetical protein [Pirellulales bacterium]